MKYSADKLMQKMRKDANDTNFSFRIIRIHSWFRIILSIKNNIIIGGNLH